jgi:hypothetical protein
VLDAPLMLVIAFESGVKPSAVVTSPELSVTAPVRVLKDET